MRRRSGRIWAGRIAAVVVLTGLAVYLASVGLDKADKLASILGLLVAAAALIAPYVLPSSDVDPGPVQRVVNTVVGGHLTQARDAKQVRVQGPITPRPPQMPLPTADPAPERQSGQYVNGVWVGGNLTQVDGSGDITIG